jgi:hypothetical protein
VATLVVPLVLFVIVAVLLAAVTGSRSRQTQWRAAADRLRLDYQPGRLPSPARIYGPLADLIITIELASSGKSESTVTRYRIRYPRLGLDLRMSPATPMTKAAALLAHDDVETGDAEFDDAFAVGTSDPQRLSTVLTADARRALLDLLRDCRSVTITDDHVSCERAGIDGEAVTLVRTTRRLVEVARLLQGRSPLQIEWEPDSPVREQPASPPPTRQPGSLLEEPDAPDPPAEPETTPEATAPEPSPPAAITGVTAGHIARELFATRGLSFRITDSFEERYRGASIDWPGEIGHVIPGIGPHDPARATIRVATVEHELFGSVDVVAVASIVGPAPARRARGSRVRLRGTLAGIDVTGRRFFVEEAVVEPDPQTPGAG